MTESGAILHSTGEARKDTFGKQDNNLEKKLQSDTLIIGETDENLRHMSNGREELFMQLQTELFDILLEIYHITPIWGSFKENFYFHWKKIIGASNIKELHAYRLIFRCMGSLRPSLTPLFVLKIIIKQLDEFRRISEPEYYPENMDLGSTIQGQAITGFHSPFVFIQDANHLNFGIEGKHLFEFDSNLFLCNPSIRQNMGGIGINGDKHVSLTDHTNAERVSDCNSNILDKKILGSLNDKPIENVREVKGGYLSGIYFDLSCLQRMDPSDKTMDTENSTSCKCKSQSGNSLDYKLDCGQNRLKSFQGCDDSNCRMSADSSKDSMMTASIPIAKKNGYMIGTIMSGLEDLSGFAKRIQNKGDLCCKLSSSDELAVSFPQKKKSRRSSEIQGVYFDKIRKLWRANWKENGRVKTKGFSVFQFGDEGAKQKAIEYRRRMEREFYAVPHHSKRVPKGETCRDDTDPASKHAIAETSASTQNDIQVSDANS